MSSMPGMDTEDEKKPKGKGVDLAIVFGGKPKGDRDSAPARGEEDDEKDEDGLPPGFEEAYAEAFPDSPADPEQMKSLKRLIMLCTDSY